MNQDTSPHETPPVARLLISTGCAHCAAILTHLAQLVKEGVVSRLEVINLNADPAAAQPGVRSVPWLRLGPFELEGAHTLAELRDWAQRAGGEHAVAEYFSHLFKAGERLKVLDMVQRQPRYIHELVWLFEQPDMDISVRLGVDATFDELSGSEVLKSIVPDLGRLTRHTEPRIRADACHYLALSAAPGAAPLIEPCREDDDPQVREIAEESLAALRGGA